MIVSVGISCPSLGEPIDNPGAVPLILDPEGLEPFPL